MSPAPVRLLRLGEVADRLGYSRRWVTELVTRGELRAVRPRPGAHWRVAEDDLDRYVARFEDNAVSGTYLRR